MGTGSCLLPILLATLIRVERALRTRLGVTKWGVLGLTLMLLGLLNLGTIAGPTEPPPRTIKAASGSGLLNSTEATWGTTLSGSDILSAANPAHILAGATVRLK